MAVIFDYIYLRGYQFFKEKGDNVPETKGSLILSLMQCLTLVDIDVVIRHFSGFTFFQSKFLVLIPLAIIGALNWSKYERNFDLKALEEKWRDQDQEKRIRNGWAISLYLLMSFMIPVMYGYLKQNLKAI